MRGPRLPTGENQVPRRPQRWQYTVVWFCATQEEGEVARACLDRRHADPTLVADSDTYYHYGEIVGDHDTHFIVIVRPTRSGKAAMSDAASQVRLNFKNIKYSFFVGIAGALPHDAGWEDPANELQRGDVVIARAQEGHNAVLEYDYANYLAYNNIQPKWISDNTAPSLQSLSNVWFDAHREGHSRAQGILANLIQRNPAFAAPPPCEDLLFHSLEPHSGKEGDCTSCSEDYRNPRRRTDRLERGCYNIKVYRGLVVTGDSVIRNPSLRAAIKSHSWGRTALCADMESAVLMDKFHPLIIRGISDYADTHYGWKWVSYAAATAAAVAKDMITRLQPVQFTAPQEREDRAAGSWGGFRRAPSGGSGDGSSSYHFHAENINGKIIAPQSSFTGGTFQF